MKLNLFKNATLLLVVATATNSRLSALNMTQFNQVRTLCWAIEDTACGTSSANMQKAIGAGLNALLTFFTTTKNLDQTPIPGVTQFTYTATPGGSPNIEPPSLGGAISTFQTWAETLNCDISIGSQALHLYQQLIGAHLVRGKLLLSTNGKLLLNACMSAEAYMAQVQTDPTNAATHIASAKNLVTGLSTSNYSGVDATNAATLKAWQQAGFNVYDPNYKTLSALGLVIGTNTGWAGPNVNGF